MFNITKQGSSLLITSNDNSQFPWKDGQMSLPMNSVVYVIDESDYIAFRSASNNDILFTALIDEIQINGTNVTKDDFILTFDNVANSAGGGGGSASAGVNSINGFQGDLTLKSIGISGNSQSLIGNGMIDCAISQIWSDDWTQQKGFEYWMPNGYGKFTFKTINGESIFDLGNGSDITIEGGGSSGVEYISTSSVPTEWDTFRGGVKLTTGFTDLNDDGIGETFDVAVNGLINGTESGSLWYGITSSDNSILLGDYSSRLDLKVNPDILGGGSSSAGVEAINIGNTIEDWTQKTGIVSFYTLFYDGSYDVSIGGTSFYGLKPIDGSIVLENAGGTVNGNFRCGIKVNEWVGTQAQYDALGTYDSGCTYYITE